MIKEKPKKLTKEELKDLQDDGVNTKPPELRSECPKERPCAYVSCRYNTYLDVDNCGNIIYNHKNKKPWQVNPELSCTLDIAEQISKDIFNGKRTKGFSNKEIGEILGGVSRETIRLMAITARNKLNFLFSLDEETMSLYEDYSFTAEEIKKDLILKDRIFDKWIKNGLAFCMEDGMCMITLQSLHDYFICNYRDFYCLNNLSDFVVEKYKLKELGESFNA